MTTGLRKNKIWINFTAALQSIKAELFGQDQFTDIQEMENQESALSDLIDGLSEKSVLILFILISPVAVVSPKAIVPLFAFTGFCGLVSWLKSGRPVILLPKVPMFLLALTLMWALASSKWAINAPEAANLTLRLMALCVCGIVLLHSLTMIGNTSRHRLENFFLAGYGLGAIALLIGYFFALITGTSLWSSFNDDPLTTLNNGATVMVLLFFPFATILWKRQHWRLAIGAGSVLLMALFFLSSDASILSLIVGACVCAFVFVLGRSGVIVMAVVTITAFIAAPNLSKTFFPAALTLEKKTTSMPSSEHRKLIWQFVNDKIDEKPWLGWGMDASRDIPKEEFRISPALEILPLHPHNTALQIRLELGWLGTILATAFLASIFWLLSAPGLSTISRVLGAGVFSSYLVTGFISYGVWQNWWIATAWIVFVLVTAASAPVISPRQSVKS
jgi:exopolysaccharide production protein ExoQ